MFEKYDQYLSSEFSDDYWSDIGISHAIDLLINFNEQDWMTLKDSCHQRQPAWCVRCAETLGDNNTAYTLEILIKLLAKSDGDVTIAVLDAINSIAITEFDIAKYSGDLLIAIADAEKNAGAVSSRMLAALRSKLQIKK